MNTFITTNRFKSGYVLGSCIWQIETNSDSIVYGLNMNYKKKQKLLDDIDYSSIVKRSILITDCNQNETREDVEERLKKEIIQTASKNGNVLIPIDNLGYIYEILYMLDSIYPIDNSLIIHFYYLTPYELFYSSIPLVSRMNPLVWWIVCLNIWNTSTIKPILKNIALDSILSISIIQRAIRTFFMIQLPKYT